MRDHVFQIRHQKSWEHQCAGSHGWRKQNEHYMSKLLYNTLYVKEGLSYIFKFKDNLHYITKIWVFSTRFYKTKLRRKDSQ